MEILLADSVDPDQMPHYVASDLDLHCLPMTLRANIAEQGQSDAGLHRSPLRSLP